MTINEILENDELLARFISVESPDELEVLLKENDIPLSNDLTAEEAFNIIKNQESGELSEDNLENVAGGIILSTTALLVLSAAEVAFIAGYGYEKLKKGGVFDKILKKLKKKGIKLGARS